MLIRYCYEITLMCQQPMSLVYLLSVHEDRAPDIRAGAGNDAHHSRRSSVDLPRPLRQPLSLAGRAGRDLTMSGDATIEDDNKPSRVTPNERELPVPDLLSSDLQFSPEVGFEYSLIGNPFG